LKIHLGCGKKYIPGFIHVDLDDYPHIDHRSTISNLSFIDKDTVELIYCCHAFEYLDRKEARFALKEWHRVLKRGGCLRLAVPDFESIIRVYKKYQDIDHRGILGPLYGRMPIKSSKGDIVLYHKTVYDYKSLKNILEDASFNNVRKWDWRETDHKDYDDFSQAYVPHMDKDNGILISLNVEANKSV